MSATIVAVYTGQGLVELIQKVFKECLPDCRLINLIDDGIIHEVIKNGEVNKKIIARLLKHYQTGVEIGGDIIVNTCSSVSEVVDIGRKIIDVPIIKIDEAMTKEAVEKYERIGVIATLKTTLNPTVRLLKAQANLSGRQILITEGLAEGAYQALIDAKPDIHDRLILERAKEIANMADCIVLAQGSMARMKDKLENEVQKEVLASPYICARHIKSLLGGLNR